MHDNAQNGQSQRERSRRGRSRNCGHETFQYEHGACRFLRLGDRQPQSKPPAIHGPARLRRALFFRRPVASSSHASLSLGFLTSRSSSCSPRGFVGGAFFFRPGLFFGCTLFTLRDFAMACPWDNPLLLPYEPQVEGSQKQREVYEAWYSQKLRCHRKGSGTLTSYHEKYQLAPAVTKKAPERNLKTFFQ